MIEEPGKVVAVDGEYAWISTIRSSACETCSAKAGCGQKTLNAMSSGRASQVKVLRSLHVEVGDEVLLGIQEQALMKASMLTYLLPLIGLIAFAGAADALFGLADPLVALSGLAGLAAGLLLVKTLSSRLSCNPQYHPQLLRRIR